MRLFDVIEDLKTILQEEGNLEVVICADHGQTPETVTSVETGYIDEEYESIAHEDDVDIDRHRLIAVIYGQ